MKHAKAKVTNWPTVRLFVHPATLAAIEAQAEQRALSVSALVREALDRAYRPEALLRP
jgi:hypothetical protein